MSIQAQYGGECANCDGTAWNDAADDIDKCHCPNPSHPQE